MMQHTHPTAFQSLLDGKSAPARDVEMTAGAASLLYATDRGCYAGLVALVRAGASLASIEKEAIAIDRARLPRPPRRSLTEIAEFARTVREGSQFSPAEPRHRSVAQSLVAQPNARFVEEPPKPILRASDLQKVPERGGNELVNSDALIRHETSSFDHLVATASPDVIAAHLAKKPQLLLRASSHQTLARLPVARAVEMRQRQTLEVLLHTLATRPEWRHQALEATGVDRRTALHLAVERNDAKTLSLLLAAGADPFTKLAVPGGKRLSRMLHAFGLSVTKTADILEYAVANDHAGLVRLLLQWDERPSRGARRFDPDGLFFQLHTTGRAPSDDVSRELRAGVLRREASAPATQPFYEVTP